MWIALCADSVLCGASLCAAILITNPYVGRAADRDGLTVAVIAYMIFSALSLTIFQSHARSARRASDRDTVRLSAAVLAANVMLALFPAGLSALELTLNFLLSLMLLGFLRMAIRITYRYSFGRDRNPRKSIPMLIYGIDAADRSVWNMLGRSERFPYHVVGYVSHYSGRAGGEIPEFRDDGDMDRILNITGAGAMLIDPDNLTLNAKQKLVEVCQKHGVLLLRIPSAGQWKEFGDGNAIQRIRKIRIEDLLERTPRCADTPPDAHTLIGKCMLITGAAGSIGSEIARQLTRLRPARMILCDTAETPLYELWLELQEKYPECHVIPCLGDVRNKAQMDIIFERFRPQAVFHAAAYKHVTMMEHMPCQAVTTNIMGTMILADLSVKHGAGVFVMISSDKAVNPTNVMGTSKRIAEMYVQSLSRKIGGGASIRFITTRFGNVLGSNGSVIPLFERQIERGGPLKVTHPDVFRYFMTIPEACGLVLEAANIGRNGEVFVLDMGQPIKIRELAENMIRLSGYEPYKEIGIEFTGLRPGEKLYEELLYDKETVEPTSNPKILIGKTAACDYERILPRLRRLIEAASHDDTTQTVRMMKTIVPEFVSTNSRFENLTPVADNEDPAPAEQQPHYA